MIMYHNRYPMFKNLRFMLQVTPIPAFADNYLWAVHNRQQAIIVDPGSAQPVMDFLEKHHLELAAILVTHWHADHIGGIEALLAHTQVPVYGPKSAHIPQVSHTLIDGDNITLLDTRFTVIVVPGHTLDHIAFHAPEQTALFCGDTLFGAGCGRLFEGTPEMMYHSLQKLARLPANTHIYCAHEYTVSNLRFALEVEPDNRTILDRLLSCEQLRKNGQCTLPSTLEEELLTNPFLRVTEDAVITQALNQGASTTDPVDIFSCLREWKNEF